MSYRYTLTRSWTHGTGRVCWVMLNPSTADDHEDDPTIRRCIRFSQDHGYAELVVVNLFAARATQPIGLLDYPDPRGPENGPAISRAVNESSAVVCAWGAGAPRKLADHTAAQTWFVAHTCRIFGQVPLCLGVTKVGAPRHPLYVAAVERFRPFPVDEVIPS